MEQHLGFFLKEKKKRKEMFISFGDKSINCQLIALQNSGIEIQVATPFTIDQSSSSSNSSQLI